MKNTWYKHICLLLINAFLPSKFHQRIVIIMNPAINVGWLKLPGLQKMPNFMGILSNFPPRVVNFPSVLKKCPINSYVFLYFKGRYFPPNGNVSWEWDSQITHFFQALLLFYIWQCVYTLLYTLNHHTLTKFKTWCMTAS